MFRSPHRFRHHADAFWGHSRYAPWHDARQQGLWPGRPTSRVWSAGRRRRRSRGPALVTIVLAGLAVFALVRLMTAAGRSNRSTAEKVGIGALIVLLGLFLNSLRRAARHHNWSN